MVTIAMTNAHWDTMMPVNNQLPTMGLLVYDQSNYDRLLYTKAMAA
jgi:hypothetical protein